MAWQKSRLYFSKKLPSPHRWGQGTVLIYDRLLIKNFELSKWIRKFDLRYGVKSGEKLKNLDQFPKHMKKIMNLVEGQPLQEITIVVFGGGTLGDFGGFVASVLKRGVRLVQIPSTWLSAVDSAHGGKTALNVSRIKNQIGTFYSAEEVFLVREVLEALPHVRSVEALGEILKINLIEGRQLWKNMMHLPKVDSNAYWKHLPLMVEAKYRVVKKDPYEQKGIRHILNLGHTMGHVWESQLKIPHGIAVLYGVAFALEWSLHRKILSSKHYYNIRLSEFGSFLPDRIDLEKIIEQTKNPQKFLLQDKKLSAHSEIRFVFLAAPGKACIQKVKINELLNELKRQAI